MAEKIKGSQFKYSMTDFYQDLRRTKARWQKNYEHNHTKTCCWLSIELEGSKFKMQYDDLHQDLRIAKA
jgi:hypothetical protein